MAKLEERFSIIEKYGSEWKSMCIYVLLDKQTGVNYLYTKSGYSAGLTPLIDKEGKPIITITH